MPEIELERGELKRLKPGHYLVSSGCLWLTVKGRDLILKAGASYRLDGVALAQAMEATQLSLKPARGGILHLSLRVG